MTENPLLSKALRIVVLVSATGMLLQPAPPGPRFVSIAIHAEKPAAFKIPRTIFGSFLEPIGNSTYNGLWAELLQNPSFESGLWSASNIARMIQDQPSLKHASQLGLPPPWAPLDPGEGNRYEPRRQDAANSSESLAIFGLPGKETGIKQQVFLPAARELRYDGSIYVKHLSGPAGLNISLRKTNAPGQVLAQTLTQANISASDSAWRKYTFQLAVPAVTVQPLDPLDFVIAVEGDERTLVDQASLTPEDAIDGLDPEMVAMAKSMHTSVVRFGGNFTSGYHWRDGVGPPDKRVSARNIAWGIPEYNTFGTDEFLRFCERIDAQPQIALNLGSGTPEEAADWVRYVDRNWSQHGGLLWELGNELWGNWNLGYPTLEELPGRTVEFSRSIRAADPEARLIATGQDPDVYKRWNASQLTDPAGTFQFLSTHFVVTTDQMQSRAATADETAKATFALPVELGRKLRAMQQQIDERLGFQNKAHIAFTEWLFVCCDGRATKAPRFDNMGGAVAAGGFFNMLLRDADIVPISNMTGIIEFAGIWKKRGRVFGTPSYYVFRMFSTADADVAVDTVNDSETYDVHQGVTRLPEIAKVPYLDTVAVMNKNRSRLTLFCVNRHLTEDIRAAITISGFPSGTKADVQTVASASIYDVNEEAVPERIKPRESTIDVANGELQYTFRHESVTRVDFTQ